MTTKFFSSLFAGLLISAVSAADGMIMLKSAQSIRLEVEEPSKRIGAPSTEEIYQTRDQLASAEKMLKNLLPKILPGAAGGDMVTIKVGTNRLGAKYKLPKLEPEEFIIAFPDAKTIVIAGGAQIGARNGVSEFLQSFCGVRWLFPGEAGLHLPQYAELKIPMKQLRGKPYFMHRNLSWPYPCEQRKDWYNSGWLGFNRSRYGINKHHNLHQLFPWKIYGKTHPEFYPKGLGPNPANDHWNPVLNAPGLTEEAVKRICEQFKRCPEQHSYSLGMNDFSRFEGAESKGLNSVGMNNYSDYYYGWINQVIAGVTKQYPDKNFGMIAYNTVTDPPSFDLDPHAMPFICIDRMRWYDPASAEIDMNRTLQWREKAAKLGWYDYIYGDQNYLVPRIYTQLMIKYLKFAAKNGVTGYYAECYSTELPTEGPKNWLVLQLLWNPDADADALLTEWYTLAVGKDAAPHLRRYFDFWEKYWREKVTKSEWFKRYKDWVYFDFQDHNYMKDLKWVDIAYCQKEMKQVLEKAKTPEQIRRAELFMKSWKQVSANIAYAMQFHRPFKGGGESRIFLNDFNRNDSLKQNEHPIPGGWIFWQSALSKAKAAYEDKTGVDGSGALAVNLKNSVRTCFARTFKTTRGRLYRFRCQIQAENTGSEGRICVQAMWRNKNGIQNNKYILTKFLAPEMRDGKWHTVEIQFCEPPIEKPLLNLYIGTKGVKKGILRIDNAELAVVLPAKKPNVKK